LHAGAGCRHATESERGSEAEAKKEQRVTIYLKVGGMLKERLRTDVDEWTRKVETAPGRTLRQVLEELGLKPVHVAMAFSGDTLVPLAYVPSDGEVITLRPPVQGG
jgi:hypothetical protein